MASSQPSAHARSAPFSREVGLLLLYRHACVVHLRHAAGLLSDGSVGLAAPSGGMLPIGI